MKIHKSGVVETPYMNCNTCNTGYEIKDKFCSKCGSALQEAVLVKEIKAKEFFGAFLNEYPDNAYFISSSGDSEESGSNPEEVLEDMKRYLTKYPNMVIHAKISWDQGFDQAPTYYFLQNGKMQTCEPKIVYEDFDPEKLV